MSKSIKPEELTNVVNEYLNNYKECIENDVIEVTDKIMEDAKQELINTSPRSDVARKTKYHKGWAVKLQSRRNGKYSKVIWNRTNYQLTHLLEFGHATRNGGRTKPIPHIRPIEEKYKVKFVDLLKRKIKEDSK